MEYQIGRYELSGGDYRTAIKVTQGTAYILHMDYCPGGFFYGLDIDEVHADGTKWPEDAWIIDIRHETNSCWLEGCDEYFGTYATREEAERAEADYFEALMKT